MCHGGQVSFFDARFGGDVDRDAFALVAIAGFDHDGQANLLRCRPSVVRAGHRTTERHRHACGMQQPLGQFFILCDGLGDRAGGVNFSGLNAALFAAPAQLNQAALGQTTEGDATRNCRIDDGGG